MYFNFCIQIQEKNNKYLQCLTRKRKVIKVKKLKNHIKINII